MIESLAAKPLDETDLALLAALQEDGRTSNVELARRVSLSPPAVHARLRRLEEQGLISAYTALLDAERLGFDMLCFIHIGLERHTTEQVERVRRAIHSMPEVLECHHVTGEFDYLLKVIVRNRHDLQQFVLDRLTPVPGLARIHTSLVLEEVKRTTALPLHALGRAPSGDGP